MYPIVRLRRNRQSGWLRDLLAETRLENNDLIYPIFVAEDHHPDVGKEKMPNVSIHSLTSATEIAKKAHELGIQALVIFPVIDQGEKSEDAEEAFNLDNIACKTIRAIKQAVPQIGVICDVALDPYTSSGHDGVIIDGDVDNDETIEALKRQALVLAKAGVDMIAPSDMMDGRVGAIRESLDAEGFIKTGIIAYSAKFASSFYSPFRDVLGSHDKSIRSFNKATYQLDIRNSKEAYREIEQDIGEGADIIMIKPALLNLDIVQGAVEAFDTPVFAYHVSGEYAMLKCAAQNEYLDWDKAIIETLTSIKRAGATAIVTYAALEVAEHLQKTMTKK